VFSIRIHALLKSPLEKHEEQPQDRTQPPGIQGIQEEWRWLLGVTLLCIAWVLSSYSGSEDLLACFAALGLVALLTAVSLSLRHGFWTPMHPTISSLGTTTLRFLTVLFALGLATATKWNKANLFCSNLLGYYFIFLVLESVLAARWYSSRSRDIPS
jgi:hypothetical protein